jgi:ankyrin repeat protein
MTIEVPGYRIVRPLGEGAMGAVYETEKLSSGQRFAVKLIHPDLAVSPGFAARFQREVAILQALRHPNIVQIFESSLVGPNPYYVMELLSGPSLEDVLQQAARLQPAEAVRILLQVLDGLAAAHGAGVIHRDVAPPNIVLVGYETGVVNLKLLDFGLARTAGAEAAGLTMAGVFVGRPSYAAPEGFLGDVFDARADIFSCGVVLFRMVTGRVPWAGGSSEEVLQERWEMRNQAAEFVAPRDFPTDVTPALVRVIQCSLARDPAKRFASAAEFQERLRAAQPGLHDRAGSHDPTVFDVDFAAPRLDLPNKEGWTPLVQAATTGDVRRVAELLREGADPRRTGESGLTALAAAAFVGDLDAVRVLRQAGADPEAATADGWTPLKLATIWCRPAREPNVPGLPAHIVSLTRRSRDPQLGGPSLGGTVRALRRPGRHLEVLRYLVDDAKVGVEGSGPEGLTALMVAAWYGGDAAVRYLLEHGARPDRVTRDGSTALLHACYWGREDVARTLIEHGASPATDAKTAGWSVWMFPLDFAGSLEWYDAQSSADGVFLGHAGVTPLHAAADSGHETLVRRLLAAGAVPGARRDDGATALSLAAAAGAESIVQVLLDRATWCKEELDQALQTATSPSLRALLAGRLARSR